MICALTFLSGVAVNCCPSSQRYTLDRPGSGSIDALSRPKELVSSVLAPPPLSPASTSTSGRAVLEVVQTFAPACSGSLPSVIVIRGPHGLDLMPTSRFEREPHVCYDRPLPLLQQLAAWGRCPGSNRQQVEAL